MAVNLKEALAIIEGGDWFGPLRYVSANVKMGTGGKVKEIPRCRIARNRSTANNLHTVTTEVTASPTMNDRKRREANHSANMTRNVELPNKMIITLHPILITHINKQAVL